MFILLRFRNYAFIDRPTRVVGRVERHVREVHAFGPNVWSIHAILDALYGHLYGLKREELVYVRNTFPVVKRKDKKEYGECRTKRLPLAYYDECVV